MKNKTIGNPFFVSGISFALNLILFVGVIITGNIMVKYALDDWLGGLFLGCIISDWFIMVIVSGIFFGRYRKKSQSNNYNLLQRMLWVGAIHFLCMLFIFPCVFGALDSYIRFSFEFPRLVLDITQIPTLIVDLLYAGILLIVLFFQKAQNF